jgi:hypothetical protein
MEQKNYIFRGSVLNFVYEMKREGGDSKIPPDGNEYHQEVQHE